jgi:hypothetical protein
MSGVDLSRSFAGASQTSIEETTVHPVVAAIMVNEIANDRAKAARHARATRRRGRRRTIRRVAVPR